LPSVEYELLSQNIWVFFGLVVFISLSGVMTPGPVFAAAVAKGYKDKKAGVKIALGHGVVEFPLMAVIALIGFRASEWFEEPAVGLVIGVVGGSLLLFLGTNMIRTRHLWTPTVHEIVFGVCGALMLAFGVYFIVGPTYEFLAGP